MVDLSSKKRVLPKAEPVSADILKHVAAAEKSMAQDQDIRDMVPQTLAVADDMTKPGLPFDQDLDPLKAEEYCEQEPWLLTSVFNIVSSAKYGIVPERFKYQAEQHDKAGCSDEAELHREAYEKTRKIYWHQMRAAIKRMEASLSRRDIGLLAENLWKSTTLQVEKEGSNISRYFDRARLDQMSSEMQELARNRVYMASRWIAMVINEIPLGEKIVTPMAKPVYN